jgi:hypothetical protein
MSDLNKIKTRLFEQIIAESILEALDFKNIEPYEGGQVSLFKTPLGMVKIGFDEVDISDITINNPHKNVLEKQSYEFYKKKVKDGYPKIYNVGYAINGIDTQYAKSDYKTLIKILYTVTLYVKKYLEAKKSDDKTFGIFISATPKDESKSKNIFNIDPQKTLLYKHIVANNLPDGYAMSETKYLSRRPGIFIYKKQLPNKK